MKLPILLRLYPARWRERYGEEIASLAAGESSILRSLDLLRGAIDAHLHPELVLPALAAVGGGTVRGGFRLSGPRWIAAVIVPIVSAVVIAGVVFGGPRLLNRVRGAVTPEELATSYVAAVRSGDALRIRWLMPTDRENLQAIPERIERYRAVSGQTLEVTYEPHPIASYLMTARITGDAFADEIFMQKQGARWYLINLP